MCLPLQMLSLKQMRGLTAAVMPDVGEPDRSTSSTLSSAGLRRYSPFMSDFQSTLGPFHSQPLVSNRYMSAMPPSLNENLLYHTPLIPPIPSLMAAIVQARVNPNNILPMILNSLQNAVPPLSRAYELEKARNLQELIMKMSRNTPQSSSFSPNRDPPLDSHSSPARKKSKKRSSRSPLRASSLSPTTFMTPSSMVSSTTTLSNDDSERSPMSASSSLSSEESGIRMDERLVDSTTTPVRRARSTSENRREKKFKCNECQKSFGYKHVLQNHQRTHTGEKPYSCTLCPKKFTRDHHLKTHMRLHTGEKPYVCKICAKNFVQVANLRRHLRVHTGEKPYPCGECGSKFSDSNQLKSHRLIHKGEKPFSCKICSGQFRRRHHLLKHKCPANVQNMISPENNIVDIQGLPAVPQISPLLSYANLPSGTDITPLSYHMFPTYSNTPITEEKKRGRKPKDPLRYITEKDPPIQTEPEDLSMNTTRTPSNICIAKVELRPSNNSDHLRFPNGINSSGEIPKEV